MDVGEVFKQLNKRRVISTGYIDVALLWVALQVADLFANAGIDSENAAR